MENEETKVTEEIATEVVEKEEKVMSFQEMLDGNKDYKSSFDKAITKATETAIKNAKESWEKEQADKIAESQKLAQMDEIQKKDYEIEALKNKLAQIDADKQASDLMAEAIRQANEKGIPLEVMTALNYKNETADSIATKIDVYSKAFQSAKNTAIETYSKEPAPQVGEQVVSKNVSQMSYAELVEYYKTHDE